MNTPLTKLGIQYNLPALNYTKRSIQGKENRADSRERTEIHTPKFSRPRHTPGSATQDHLDKFMNSWEECRENVFVRALGGAELPYVRLIHENPCARQAIEIHCVLEFQSDHDSHQLEEALRSAWKALRLLKSPDIATTCDPGEQKKYYQVASPAALTEWEQQHRSNGGPWGSAPRP